MSKSRKIFGVYFKAPNSMDEAEVLAYAEYVGKKHPDWMRNLRKVVINFAEGEHIDLNYFFEPLPFERIRRITGYLSEENRWNAAKKAELDDRVKHGLS